MRRLGDRRRRIAHRHHRQDVSSRVDVQQNAPRLRQNFGCRRRNDRRINRVGNRLLTLALTRQNVSLTLALEYIIDVGKTDHGRLVRSDLLLEHLQNIFHRASTVGIRPKHFGIQHKNILQSI